MRVRRKMQFRCFDFHKVGTKLQTETSWLLFMVNYVAASIHGPPCIAASIQTADQTFSAATAMRHFKNNVDN